MSRILGRINDVLNTSKELQQDFPHYKKDNTITSWDDIKKIKTDLNPYLPEIAKLYINKEGIDILNNPLRIYTFTSILEDKNERRIIRFPSSTPKKEFEREYAFYLGLILSSFQNDTEEEVLEMGKEFDDILPLLLDYIYLKHNNINDERFSLKYLNYLKKYTKSFPNQYKKYNKFYEFSSTAETYDLTEKTYEKFVDLCDDQDEMMERVTLPNIIKLSSFDGVLQIIDKDYSNKELRKLIEELMLNEDENRQSILYDRGIDTYGYKRLRKEIDKYKKG